ncbi:MULTISPECIES: alpha/beta fold hydrolase [unclassified Pseudarthrobacter]|uniref:alpha/beta fold hydrolase n=1 Tax=unclassified Pseudarthrobacter TaxID=2647000 RepID=UPI0030782A9A
MTIDLFPGFTARSVRVDGLDFFMRIGGPENGSPVVLLHGFPQTHECWHGVAPELARTHRVVCLDLKGYGQTSAPKGDGGVATYSKRTMAQEVISVMKTLGHDRFSVVGHDRGALVGYRMALDTPEAVEKLAILDNFPTHVIWEYMATNAAFTPHWRSYAQPAPKAEEFMTTVQIEELLRNHTADGTLTAFAPAALENYRRSWADPARIHAFCEDYRAGAGSDPEADRADIAVGKTVDCPTLILWGEKFLGHGDETPTEIWQRTFAPHATGVEVPAGHFNAEESPKETAASLVAFLNA